MMEFHFFRVQCFSLHPLWTGVVTLAGRSKGCLFSRICLMALPHFVLALDSNRDRVGANLDINCLLNCTMEQTINLRQLLEESVEETRDDICYHVLSSSSCPVVIIMVMMVIFWAENCKIQTRLQGSMGLRIGVHLNGWQRLTKEISGLPQALLRSVV